MVETMTAVVKRMDPAPAFLLIAEAELVAKPLLLTPPALDFFVLPVGPAAADVTLLLLLKES